MFPEFDNPETLPQQVCDLGDGYIPLTAMDIVKCSVTGPKGEAILLFLQEQCIQLEDPRWEPIVKHWAWWHLLTSQIAWCAWKERVLEVHRQQSRHVHMVKACW